ncbi:transposable element Tc3 transposase [Trichonephila clavipes]|nr:transposable element Tc3 transposase [Trichonephila clavipes]
MLESPRSQTEVSRILNVDQSVISRLWQRFQRAGNVTRQPVSVNQELTTPRQDRYLVISVQTSEGAVLQSTWFGARSRHRNTNFETNCLQETQSCWPYARRPAVCIPLHVCA